MGTKTDIWTSFLVSLESEDWLLRLPDVKAEDIATLSRNNEVVFDWGVPVCALNVFSLFGNLESHSILAKGPLSYVDNIHKSVVTTCEQQLFVDIVPFHYLDLVGVEVSESSLAGLFFEVPNSYCGVSRPRCQVLLLVGIQRQGHYSVGVSVFEDLLSLFFIEAIDCLLFLWASRLIDTTKSKVGLAVLFI